MHHSVQYLVVDTKNVKYETKDRLLVFFLDVHSLARVNHKVSGSCQSTGVWDRVVGM